jgi:aryl-alcohol dehydrogenase-like predicted oxidoreductase
MLPIRALGTAPFSISAVGLGTWAMGGVAWGPQRDEESVATILGALEMGVNWIDTAPVYGWGHAERVIARAVHDWRDRPPRVFTKCGLAAGAQGPATTLVSPAELRTQCELSLGQLRTSAIDLYQLHRTPSSRCALEDAIATLESLRSEGKILAFGLSNASSTEIAYAHGIASVAAVQLRYSLIHREAEIQTLSSCQRQDIGVIVHSTLAGGLLTGTMTEKRLRELPPEDWRRSHPDFAEPALSRNRRAVRALAHIANRHGLSLPALAVAWTLRQPGVSGAAVGVRNPTQLIQSMPQLTGHAYDIAIDEAGLTDVSSDEADHDADAGHSQLT